MIYLNLAVGGFLTLWSLTWSTRAVSKDSYRNVFITSLIAGAMWWIGLMLAVPNLHSSLRATIYIFSSTLGRVWGVYSARMLFEGGWRECSGTKLLYENYIRIIQSSNIIQKYVGPNLKLFGVIPIGLKQSIVVPASPLNCT